MMDEQPECIFCRIASGDIPADVVAEGAEWVAFRDLRPQAPTHVLVVSRRHVENIDTLGPDDAGLGDALFEACRQVAKICELDAGYRVLTNVGAEGGQEVLHLHLHVLGGRRMGWPPG
ncbi:MAG: HIT domain-containing protein [Gemmatimonadota bacterium]